MKLLTIAFALSYEVLQSNSCYIWGTDSGECSILPLDDVWRSANMPYCYDYVTYPTCIPKFQELEPSIDYPTGRWFNHTVKTKDKWVETNCEEHLLERRSYERNKTMRNAGINEYGDSGEIAVRVYKNTDCRRAFKRYFCYINFPRCDEDTDQSLPTCRSACENFFLACNYETKLWRCGNSKYFNGYTAESPSGNRTYLRDYFPGQPFRENEFTRKGEPIAICTPSVKGAANSNFQYSSHAITILLIIIMGFYLCCSNT